ncbi:MAG: GNAT family N-acetyltransferase [Acidimicrobiales bacterium]
MSSHVRPELEIRPYSDADHRAVLDLLMASHGWLVDGDYGAFYQWKHVDNCFGRSPAWVAVANGRVVGLRVFMRWEFQLAGRVVRAVRAVDTATHPDFQGRGIFARLTLHGVDHLREEGVDFIFNTPNDQSRPGYLKMGWKDVGRLPPLARPRVPWAFWRMARARTHAELWSLPCDGGLAAEELLADGQGLERLLATLPSDGERLQTRRSVEYLRWRFTGFSPLRYRVVLAGTGVEDGLAVFRLRRRGAATEAAIVEVLVPEGDHRRAGRLMGETVRRSGADYGVRLATDGLGRMGFVPVPGQGPLLVWRAVCDPEPPALGSWRLTLGDVEMF